MKRIFSILFALVLVLSLSLIPSALVGADPGPGIVGLWHFDGNANDSSGNGNDGTVYGGAGYVSGKFGQALSFDGMNDYVDCAAAVDDSITTGVTLEAWIKPAGKQNGGIISNDITYSSKKGYDFFLWAAHDTYGRLYIDFGNGSTLGRTWWAIPSADWYNQWHHVAATWDGSTVRLYADGSEVGTASLSGTYSDPGKDTLIGGINYGVTLPYCPFNGLIDEVRIRDEAVNPVTVPLRAGQHMDAGTVTVWEDGIKLYVKYQTSGGWCLTETHLHVATSMDAIPQRNGNPVPGQFDYSMEHDCATAYTYTIPLNWTPCTDLYIAAHAEVQKLSDVMTTSLASGDGPDSVLVIAEDANNLGYPIDYPGPYGGTPTSSVVIEGTEATYSGWPTITGAQWISDSLENPGIVNSWRLFTRNFSIPSNATNISGTLQIDSDNAEEAKINGNPDAGLVYGEVYGAFEDDGEWGLVSSWLVGSYLQPGSNTLEVMVRNYYWEPSQGMWNYAGLIYKMDYEYQLLFTETAWGAGLDFPGKNWATYFTYHVE